MKKEITAKIKGMNKSQISAHMAKTRNEFIIALGLPKATELGDNSGYKFQAVANPETLDRAIALYTEYKTISDITGTGRPIVAKMERNLRNSDRASKFAQIARENAKADSK